MKATMLVLSLCTLALCSACGGDAEAEPRPQTPPTFAVEMSAARDISSRVLSWRSERSDLEKEGFVLQSALDRKECVPLSCRLRGVDAPRSQVELTLARNRTRVAELNRLLEMASVR